MANRKLMFWARITRRPVCQYCGELWATMLKDDFWDGPTSACFWCDLDDPYPAPEDLRAYQDALAALPWLLRRRPSLRDLNQLDAAWWAAKDGQAMAEAEQNLWDACDRALWPVRAAHAIGALFGWGWRELGFWTGVGIEKIRIHVLRQQCTTCDKPATTLLHDYPNRSAPTCDGCYDAAATAQGGA